MTRRDFIKSITTGAIALVAGLFAFGCGKKETPKEKKAAEPERTDEQKKEYVFTNCICGKCPSWLECGEKGGFCLVGKSTCIKEKKGCICPDCPVTKKMDLKWGYHRTRGSAASMMEAEAAG
jgi:anaerobic selenocysteine-containing dehydrogenase